MLKVVVKSFLLDIFAETIFLEMTISNRKWCIFFIYKPPKITKCLFSQGVSKTLNQAVYKCDNILIAGDFNINISNVNDENTSYFSKLWNNFNLKDFVTKPTFCKSLKGSITDLILTNRPRSFQKTSVCEIGLGVIHI